MELGKKQYEIANSINLDQILKPIEILPKEKLDTTKAYLRNKYKILTTTTGLFIDELCDKSAKIEYDDDETKVLTLVISALESFPHVLVYDLLYNKIIRYYFNNKIEISNEEAAQKAYDIIYAAAKIYNYKINQANERIKRPYSTTTSTASKPANSIIPSYQQPLWQNYQNSYMGLVNGAIHQPQNGNPFQAASQQPSYDVAAELKKRFKKNTKEFKVTKAKAEKLISIADNPTIMQTIDDMGGCSNMQAVAVDINKYKKLIDNHKKRTGDKTFYTHAFRYRDKMNNDQHAILLLVDLSKVKNVNDQAGTVVIQATDKEYTTW